MWKWATRAFTVAAGVLLVAAHVLREAGVPKAIWLRVGYAFVAAVVLGTIASIGRAIASRQPDAQATDQDNQPPTQPPAA
jgi:hypothetical protein